MVGQAIKPHHPNPMSPSIALCSPIAGFVEAMNGFDLEALLAAFADDAMVNDQLRDYSGKLALREWAERDVIGERLSMTVTNVVKHYCNVFVTANLDGDFDKRGLPDPLVVTFYFTVCNQLIVQLIILRKLSSI